MTAPLTIRSSSLDVGIAPAIGASITHCRYRSSALGRWVSVMPESPTPLPSSSKSSSFIMAPYSNRIRDGRFTFEGKEYLLRDPEKHAIHGDVRNRRWVIDEQHDDRVTLSFDSRSVDDINFPSSFSVTTTMQVTGNSFVQHLALTNHATSPMPAGFGFHPYFNRALSSPDDEVVAQFSCEGVYPFEGALPLPIGAAIPLTEPLSYHHARPLARGYDHCFSGWRRSASFRWTRSMITMAIDADAPLSHLIVYTPTDAPVFAFEPATHAIDSFNLAARGITGTGTSILAPDETLSARWSLRMSEC